MVERFKRTKDSFVNKNRNISSKDYISLCYKQITINPSLQTRGSLGIISFGSYHIKSSGNETRAKPKPVIPFIRLEKVIINITQMFGIAYRVKKNNEPIAITAHKIIPSAKLFGPDFLISLTVIFEPIRNKAITIPRLPNQLK